MKQLILGLALLALGACAGPPIATPVAIDIPIPAPCRITPVAEPDWPLAHARPDDDLFTKTRFLLSELDTRRAYEDILQAKIAECR